LEVTASNTLHDEHEKLLAVANLDDKVDFVLAVFTSAELTTSRTLCSRMPVT
jgi:hypothetical protein